MEERNKRKKDNSVTVAIVSTVVVLMALAIAAVVYRCVVHPRHQLPLTRKQNSKVPLVNVATQNLTYSDDADIDSTKGAVVGDLAARVMDVTGMPAGGRLDREHAFEYTHTHTPTYT